MAVLEDRLPDTQAGFRPARGCRDNVCALRWFIDMVLRQGRQALVTFIDYSAAFDTESQLFIGSALAETGVSSKVRRIVGGYLLARVLHRRAGSYLQAIRSREPWHDSRHGCAHRPYGEV